MNEHDVLKDLYDVLLTIKVRPGMYLGQKSLSVLNTYINGFLMGAQVFIGEKSHYEFFPGFQEWIAQRYSIKTTQHWSDIILFYSMSEERALYHFYDLLDEFLRSYNVLDCKSDNKL